MVLVSDPRLAEINRFIETKIIQPATIRLVDIAGLVRGASQGEGLGNQFLGHIREVDAILHVVRCFEHDDVVHVDGEVNPLRDVETIEMELMIADSDTVEKRRKRIAKMPNNKEESQLLGQVSECLATGKWLHHLSWNERDRTLLQPLNLLSMKPILYVANIGESEVGKSLGPYATLLKEHAEAVSAGFLAVSGALESELIQMDAEDAKEFMADYGLQESGLNALSREAYRLLGLHSFFTAGPKEIRAWTIARDTKAPQAAGVIHSDFERGFIRAEIYTIEDLKTYGSEAAIRAQGLLRSEGREYVFQDGDIALFRFNV
jgi:hypothetical protein